MSEPPRGVASTPVPHPVQGKMYHRATDVQTVQTERAHQTGRSSGLRRGGAHEPVKRNVSILVSPTAISSASEVLGSFNDAFSCSEYVASNDRVISEQGIGKGVSGSAVS
jgi:hypothetical protein